MDPKSVSSGDAKKCQQAFLAPLPGKALEKNLVGYEHSSICA